MGLRPVGDVALERADRRPARPSCARRHRPSHWVSWGQTRPVTHGRALSSSSESAAPAMSPRRRWSMKQRDVDADRAAIDALGVLALEAALGLEDRQVLGEAQVDLLERVRARLGVLLGHRDAVDGHPLARIELDVLAGEDAPDELLEVVGVGAAGLAPVERVVASSSDLRGGACRRGPPSPGSCRPRAWRAPPARTTGRSSGGRRARRSRPGGRRTRARRRRRSASRRRPRRGSRRTSRCRRP